MKKNFITYFSILSIVLVFVSATVIKLKNVLIIGDSISIGYTPFIQKSLSDVAVVEHNAGNGGSTQRGIQSIEKWLGNTEWNVIVFNFGLHDMVYIDSLKKYDVIKGKQAITLEVYKKNLEFIISKLKKTTATLIFVNTTMVAENAAGRKVEDPAKYNTVALDVMKKNKIQVIDLYSASLKIHPENSKPGNVHYTEKGYELLSEPIIKAISEAIK